MAVKVISYTCDVCKSKIADTEQVMNMTINDSSFDLCPVCWHELKTWKSKRQKRHPPKP